MMLFFAAALLVSVETTDHTVPAEVRSVYDGDTIRVTAQIWPGFEWKGSVRVAGIDTPELSPRHECPQEAEMAQAAKALVLQYITPKVMLVAPKNGKYAGRVIADVYTADGVSLAHLLISAGLARSYKGGKRESWCKAPRPEFGLRQEHDRRAGIMYPAGPWR